MNCQLEICTSCNQGKAKTFSRKHFGEVMSTFYFLLVPIIFFCKNSFTKLNEVSYSSLHFLHKVQFQYSKKSIKVVLLSLQSIEAHNKAEYEWLTWKCSCNVVLVFADSKGSTSWMKDGDEKKRNVLRRNHPWWINFNWSSQDISIAFPL